MAPFPGALGCPVTMSSLSPAPLPSSLTHPHPHPLPLQILEGNRMLMSALGSGLWPIMVLLSEVVQTFILADFW